MVTYQIIITIFLNSYNICKKKLILYLLDTNIKTLKLQLRR